MNRLPRRPPRQQPPLRGRLAATSSSETEQTRSTVAIAPRPRPTRRRRRPAPAPTPPTDIAGLYQILAQLYLRWPGLFRFLNRPWKWLMLVVVIILLLSAIGRLP